MNLDQEYDKLVAALDRRWTDLTYADIAVLRRGIATAKAIRHERERDEEWALRIGEGPAVFRTLDGLEAFVGHVKYVYNGHPMGVVRCQVREKSDDEPITLTAASVLTVRKIRTYQFEGWRHSRERRAIAIYQEVAP